MTWLGFSFVLLVGEGMSAEGVRRRHGGYCDGMRAWEACTSRAKALAGVERKRKIAPILFICLLLCVLFICLLFQSALFVSLLF